MLFSWLWLRRPHPRAEAHNYENSLHLLFQIYVSLFLIPVFTTELPSFCPSWKLLITSSLLEWALPWTLNHFASDLKPSDWDTEFWQLTGPFDETVGTVGFWGYLLLSSLLNVRPFQLTLAAIITHRRAASAFASGLALATSHSDWFLLPQYTNLWANRHKSVPIHKVGRESLPNLLSLCRLLELWEINVCGGGH